jgi:nicotinate-nucleotide adenylyltransferase
LKIGLFFGSFNPVHTGHMIIANFMVQSTDLEQVWLVVSPQNPFKPASSLASDYDRLHWVQLAIGENTKLKASNIEFSLPKPSYTIDTLTYLAEKFPEHEFVLIMGGDNLASLPKWKNYDQILRRYRIYLYKRPRYELGPLEQHASIRLVEAPLLDLSASYIRQCLQQGLSIQYLVPDKVYEALAGKNFYRV